MYVVEKLIHRGYFSLTYKAFAKNEEEDEICESPVAYKRTYLLNDDAVECAFRECRTLRRLSRYSTKFPAFPSLQKIFMINQSVVVVTKEPYEKTLKDVLLQYSPLKLSVVRVYCQQLVKALEYLHNKNIIYLNLDFNTILISDSGYLLLSDFSRSHCISLSKEWALVEIMKRLYYICPEMANGMKSTKSADIWELGILIATLFAGNVRQRNPPIDPLEAALTGHYHIRNYSSLPRDLREFFDICFAPDTFTDRKIEKILAAQIMTNRNRSEIPTPKGTDIVGFSSLPNIDPYRNDILEAASARDVPRLTYSIKRINKTTQHSLLAVFDDSNADARENYLTEEQIHSRKHEWTFDGDDETKPNRKRPFTKR